MFMRLRWFLLGVMATVGATAYVVSRARRLRERLSAETVVRVGALTVADLMEAAGHRIKPTASEEPHTVLREAVAGPH